MTVIASWNINSIRIRLELIEKLLKKIEPDIVLFQEIKCTNGDFPNFFENFGYKAIVNGQKGKYGTAVIFKEKIHVDELEIQDDFLNKESRTNLIYIKKLDLNILNVYTPNGNPISNKEKFDFKISWLQKIKKLSKKFIDNNKNLLIAGDFNVIEEVQDVRNFPDWENDALGHFITREKFREILSTGLTNIVRLFNPPGSKYSFWDYQRACWERNDGLLIDHFLMSPRYVSNVKKIRFESDFRGFPKPSDHIPIWIDLNI